MSFAAIWGQKLPAVEPLKNCQSWCRRHVNRVNSVCIYIKYNKNITRWLIRRQRSILYFFSCCRHLQEYIRQCLPYIQKQGLTSFLNMKHWTCLLVARIYPIHTKIIRAVQWYVLCPILSILCIIIISTYVFKHGFYMPANW